MQNATLVVIERPRLITPINAAGATVLAVRKNSNYPKRELEGVRAGIASVTVPCRFDRKGDKISCGQLREFKLWC